MQMAPPRGMTIAAGQWFKPTLAVTPPAGALNHPSPMGVGVGGSWGGAAPLATAGQPARGRGTRLRPPPEAAWGRAAPAKTCPHRRGAGTAWRPCREGGGGGHRTWDGPVRAKGRPAWQGNSLRARGPPAPVLIEGFRGRRKSYKVSLFKCLIHKLDCYTIHQKVN